VNNDSFLAFVAIIIGGFLSSLAADATLLEGSSKVLQFLLHL